MKTMAILLLVASTVCLGENALADSRGEELFVEKCAMCHREMGMGTMQLARRMPIEEALLENRKFLPAVYVELAVRNGLGIMFPLSRAEVSEAQLRLIVEYLAKETK